MKREELVKTLKGLEGRKLLGVAGFDDEFDGERVDLYFDGDPQMVLRLRADCGVFRGVEVKQVREMAPLYQMGDPKRNFKEALIALYKKHGLVLLSDSAYHGMEIHPLDDDTLKEATRDISCPE